MFALALIFSFTLHADNVILYLQTDRSMQTI